MRYSIALPFPSGEPNPGEIDDLVEIARAIEATGLHACSVTDHPFPVSAPGRPGHQALDPFVLLAHLAAATERLLLHFSLIVLPYRNPFVVARMLATLDLTSRGRVIAGLGAGYLRPEFDALGAGFDGRGEQLEEDVAAMKAAWTGEPVTMATSRYRADGNVMRPRPLTAPHPPLWRGGNSRRAIESAARSFEGWEPFEVAGGDATDTATAALSFETLESRIAVLREACDEAGRAELPDICLVRPSPGWLREPDRAAAEVGALAGMGVTWLDIHLAGRTAGEVIEEVHGVAAVAATASA